MSDVYTEAARVAEEHLLACYELMDSEDSPASGSNRLAF